MTRAFALVTALLLLPGCDGGGDGGSSGESGTAGSGGGGSCYDAREAEKPAVTMSVQDTWGSACKTNADCVAVLGEGAVCDFSAVVYELPGGYCTKPCTIGDDPNNSNLTFELDDPECDPNGGVHCIGANGFYTRCAVPCSDDSQCGREGYFCRTMPQIGAETDPKVCLMDDCCTDNSCTP